MTKIFGRVTRVQITHKGATYRPNDWITFVEGESGRAMRLAADGLIEIHDYSDIMPKDVTIEMLQSSEHSDFADRLGVTLTDNKAWDIKSDVGLIINNKDTSIVKNPAAFAAIVSNLKYDFFCSVVDYERNLNQLHYKNKDNVRGLLPDMRIPVLSANWIIWRNKKAPLVTMQRMDTIRRDYNVDSDVALTIACYLEKPYLWIYPMEWK